MEKKTIKINLDIKSGVDVTLEFIKGERGKKVVCLDESEARQLQSALNEIFGDRVKEQVKPKHGLLFVRHGDYYVYEIIGTNSEKCLVRWFESRNEQIVYYSIEEATKYLNNGDWNKIN